MRLAFPQLSLVVLIGPSGSGKSSFARKHFLPTEVVSSDGCRALVSDDENALDVNAEAFSVLHEILRQRLKLGRLTVLDATNLDPERRKEMVGLARSFHVLPSAVVFKLPKEVCIARNMGREDRNFGPEVIQRQAAQMRRGLKGLKKEGFRSIRVFDSEEEVEAVSGIDRERLHNDRREETGPFDIVGDVHGCAAELGELVGMLGYVAEGEGKVVRHPEGRRLVFVGDLVDRGPDSPWVLEFVMANVAAGSAICVPGNHDMKLLKHLQGKQVKLTHGLEGTVEQLGKSGLDHRGLGAFLDGLVSHYVFDGGKLVVAHAGLAEEMQGRGSGAVRSFCLYGATTGERDELGLPERLDWAGDYRGEALVVYGHTPNAAPRWLNNTVNIDTGCVYGGKLTALRYPELEPVSVAARREYAVSARPFLEGAGGPSAQQVHDQILDIEDILGRRFVDTRYRTNITLRTENVAAAIEIMSRFAVDPRWLIYLPPTMSPCATSGCEGWLERPEEAFAYYRKAGVGSVVCEEKHMGSRAVAVVCRRPEVAVERFGLEEESGGVIYTRTGRAFFEDGAMAEAVLAKLDQALEGSGIWDELGTDWLCLDCELMPWSVKAQELLERQYGAVGAAGIAYHSAGNSLVERALANDGAGWDEGEMRSLEALKEAMVAGRSDFEKYRRAYGNYCWDVLEIDDLRLAPFHFLAGEGGLLTGRDHLWHMGMAERLADFDRGELFQRTRWREVELGSEEAVREAVAWWESMTEGGGEGMVVKPLAFVARDGRGSVVQPAVKCRGRGYLRLIYGATYTEPEHLRRLKDRGLGHKRSMAEREFFLGLEGLERFVEGRPLRDVHECVLAVLAMESEAVDPRL